MDRRRSAQILSEWDRLTAAAPRPVAPRPAASTTTLAAYALASVMVVAVALAATSLWASFRQDEGGSGRGPLASASAAWGPLAIVPAPQAVAEAQTTGILRITESCALLEEPEGALALLIWPANRTTWVVEEGAIRFTNLDNSTVTLRDGERVSLGGGGSSLAEGGIPGDEFVRQTEWVSPPSPSCPNDVRWSVGHTAKVEDAG